MQQALSLECRPELGGDGGVEVRQVIGELNWARRTRDQRGDLRVGERKGQRGADQCGVIGPADRLDAADLLFTFEDDFGIVVPDDVARSMRSVGQVVEGLRGLDAGAAGTS